MNSVIQSIFISLLLINIISVHCVRIARIANAIYTTGIPFSRLTSTTSNACLCSCIAHPHCLSISVTSTTTLTLSNCQLFATYPTKSSQLSASSTSTVIIYTDRIMNSVYINNGSRLTNPTNLFSNTTNPWIPVFKLFTGNNQSFLWLNSSNLTTLTNIPKTSINQSESHWFNILISQWNTNSYIPSQMAIAFIVNRTNIFEFLIFNSSQSNITNWFSILRLISNQYWGISQYQNTTVGQTQMKAIYTDNNCIRSFNTNFKSGNGCSGDFYGFFFLYGGYKDSCIAAVRNISKVLIPTIFYCPTATYTSGDLNDFSIADGLMGFVR